MQLNLWPALVCAGVGIWAQEATAQSAASAPETAPSFPELFRQAERMAPRLRELDATVDAALGRARQAHAWPNPVAGAELEDVAGTGAYHGTSQSQLTFSISEPIELGGQRGARIAAGKAEVKSAEAQRLQARLDFGYELAIAYARAEAAQAHLAIATEDLARAQEDVRSARALVSSGKEAELRGVQADAAAASAQAEIDAVRADSAAALARLSSLAGRSDIFAAVTPSLLNSHGDDNPGATPTSGTESFDPASVRLAIADQNAAERRVDVERKRAIPTPSISIGVRRLKPDDATTFVFGVSVPLPLFDRNRGQIAAARADLSAAEARASAARLEAAAAFRAAVSQLEAARSRQAAANLAEQAARESYRLSHIGYDAGRTPLIELLSARRALTDAQERALEARVARVTAQADLARLSGRIPFVE